MLNSFLKYCMNKKEGRVNLILPSILTLIICIFVGFIFFKKSPDAVPIQQENQQNDNSISRNKISSTKTNLKEEFNDLNIESSKKSYESPMFRIYGVVHDNQNQPLTNVTVCWLPVRKMDLMFQKNDGLAFECPLKSERFQDPKLHNAIERSIFVNSDKNGFYELLIPQSDKLGVVLTLESNYQMIISSVREKDICNVTETDKEYITGEVEINFKLQQAGSISGTVTVEETGKPAKGVVVVAGLVKPNVSPNKFMIQTADPSTIVGKNGRYKLQGLALGKYKVMPAPGRSNYLIFPDEKGQTINLDESREVKNVDYKVKIGCIVYGFITGPDNEPISNVSIDLNTSGSIFKVFPKALLPHLIYHGDCEGTNSEGYYKIQGLIPNVEYNLKAKKDGYTNIVSSSFQFTEDVKELEMNLSMDYGWSVSGRVLFSNGEVAPKIRVHLINVDRTKSGKIKPYKITKKNGEFKFQKIPLGTYELLTGKISSKEIPNPEKKITEVTVDGGGDITDIELVLNKNIDKSISGIVVDDIGIPINNVSIRIYSGNSFSSSKFLKSNTEGQFSVKGLEDKLYNIAVGKSGYSEKVIKDVKIESHDLTIVLDRFAQISGRVIIPGKITLSSKGHVVPAVIGETDKINNIQLKKRLQKTVKNDGSFLVEVPSGSIKLMAKLTGFAIAWSDQIHINPGQEYTGVEIRVTRGATVYGRVVHSDNTPVIDTIVKFVPLCEENAFGKLYNINSGYETFATSDNKGFYEASNLAAGEYAITASRSKYAPSAPVAVVLKDEQMCKVPDIVLLQESVIKGQVMENDKPKEKVRIQLESSLGSKKTITRADGKFEFRQLKAGKYFLSFDSVTNTNQHCKKTQWTTLREEEEIELEIVFGDGYRIHGMLHGIPLSSINNISLQKTRYKNSNKGDFAEEISQKTEKLQISTVFVHPDGTYEFNDVESGKYIIEVWKNGENVSPCFKEEITVEKQNLKMDIEIK